MSSVPVLLHPTAGSLLALPHCSFMLQILLLLLTFPGALAKAAHAMPQLAFEMGKSAVTFQTGINSPPHSKHKIHRRIAGKDCESKGFGVGTEMPKEGLGASPTGHEPEASDEPTKFMCSPRQAFGSSSC